MHRLFGSLLGSFCFLSFFGWSAFFCCFILALLLYFDCRKINWSDFFFLLFSWSGYENHNFFRIFYQSDSCRKLDVLSQNLALEIYKRAYVYNKVVWEIFGHCLDLDSVENSND